MELQTDLKVIARLAEEREDENWRFRTLLKNHDVPVEEMDAIVHRIHRDVAAAIDCCACSNCCRRMLPTLDAADVTRLATGLELSEAAVVDRYLVRDEGEAGTYTFNAKPCPLLEDGRCTAYDDRPDECRSYPHLHKDLFVSRLIGVVQDCSVCPIVFNVFERLKDEL